MNRKVISIVVSILTLAVAVTFFVAPGLAMAQGGGGLGIPLEPPSKPQLPFTPSESAIQTLNTDPDFSAYADRITKAVSGNTVMLKTITNTVEACLTKMLTADEAGVAACADFVEAQNKAFSIFLRENQNLSNQILYGG